MAAESYEINPYRFKHKVKSLAVTSNLFGLIPRQVATLLRVNEPPPNCTKRACWYLTGTQLNMITPVGNIKSAKIP